MFWSSDSDKGVGRRGSCLLLNSMRRKKNIKRAITAPWQASELSWDGCLLVNSPLGGNFLPSPRRSQDPENWGQAPPISGSQSVSLLHGTPRRGPLCTVEHSRDFTDAPTGQRHSLRAETRGLGGRLESRPLATKRGPRRGPQGMRARRCGGRGGVWSSRAF